MSAVTLLYFHRQNIFKLRPGIFGSMIFMIQETHRAVAFCTEGNPQSLGKCELLAVSVRISRSFCHGKYGQTY